MMEHPPSPPHGHRRFIALGLIVALSFVALWLMGQPARASLTVRVVSGSAADHTCALLTDGTLSCWGENEYGQLGDGTTVDQLSPTTVPVESVVDVATGGHHTCAARADGSVWCWGRNVDGQLGDDRACGIACPPVQALGIDSAIGVTAGRAHSCALLAGDEIACWGNNDHGQVGLPPVGQDRTVPAEVPLLSAVSEVEAGDWHTCALLPGGSAKCWGENFQGQLGNGISNVNADVTPDAVAGLSGATKLALGAEHSCALVGSSVRCWGLGFGLTPADVALSGVASDLAAGRDHTCAIVDGATECWGGNDDGQLGQPSTAARVTAGQAHSCASTVDDYVFCWGANASGQVGDGTTAGGSAPVIVVGLPHVSDTDLDGCDDDDESGADVTSGGLRDSKNFWDFYDTDTENGLGAGTHLEGTVSLSDLFRIAGRFGQEGDPTINPLSDASGPAYHTRFDRGDQVGEQMWNRGPADGAIGLSDVFAASAQFGHDCS